MSNVIEEIKRFQTDRELHLREYDDTNELINILEELGEIQGVTQNVDREELTNLANIVQEWFKSKADIKDASPEEKVDGYADIIVFCIGAIMKLGYKPTVVLEEVGKEINSRVGKIIDGKFIKDKSEAAKAKWYKADYSKAKENK